METPKRSLTTKLKPFLRRQQQRDSQQQQQQLQTPRAQHQPQPKPAMEQQQQNPTNNNHRTPSRQLPQQQPQPQQQPPRKPSTLHKLGSLMAPHHKDRSSKVEPTTTATTPSAPRYMLAPDQGPSPEQPSPPVPLRSHRRRARYEDGYEEVRTTTMGGLGLTTPTKSPLRRQQPQQQPKQQTTMMMMTMGGGGGGDRPKGPRGLPQGPTTTFSGSGVSGGERRMSSSSSVSSYQHQRDQGQMLFAERSPAEAVRRMKESSEWHNRASSSARDSYQQQQQLAAVPPWKGGGAAPREVVGMRSSVAAGTKPARTGEAALSDIGNNDRPATIPAVLRLHRKPVAYHSYDGGSRYVGTSSALPAAPVPTTSATTESSPAAGDLLERCRPIRGGAEERPGAGRAAPPRGPEEAAARTTRTTPDVARWRRASRR
ncbi:hypothetical protein SLS55_001656 [Diplodia seriata]|uniref:Uncharacterized protein n=1 Tax=Diplodia seriata TaxID=420778 RepID=A0ABR3CSK5_9PEZI